MTALSGQGFFVTSTSTTVTEANIELTDAGSFGNSLVRNGTGEEVYLTDIKGNFLLGWPFSTATNDFDIDTNSITSLQPIRIDQNANTYDAAATTAAEIAFNLDATAIKGETVGFRIPILDGSGEPDGLNDGQELIATFTKTATANTWDLVVTASNDTVTVPATTLQVVFDAEGRLASIGGAGTNPIDISATWTNSGATTPLTLDLTGSSSFGGDSTLIDLRTNGNRDGLLSDVAFGDGGAVIGSFTNGLRRPLARVAVADVIEPNNLRDAGQTHFRLGNSSGDLELLDLANTDRVHFVPSALEESTTDLSMEFTNLIVTQRAYSSASTSLKTIDEMVRTASDLKD